jgi:hypothetical protein
LRPRPFCGLIWLFFSFLFRLLFFVLPFIRYFPHPQTAAELRHATRDSKAKTKQYQDQVSRLTAKANVGDTDTERLTKQLNAAVAQQEDQRKALRNANTELEALRLESHKLTLELERLRCVRCCGIALLVRTGNGVRCSRVVQVSP